MDKTLFIQKKTKKLFGLDRFKDYFFNLDFQICIDWTFVSVLCRPKVIPFEVIVD